MHLGLQTKFFKSELCLYQHFCFLGMYLDIMVCMYVSQSSDKLGEKWHFVHSLLQRYSVTVHHVMSFLGKAYFCVSGHSQH